MFFGKGAFLEEKNKHRDSISLIMSELAFDKKKYKNASDILRSAIRKYQAAELRYVRKDSARAALRKEDAASVLKSAYIGYRQMRDRIDKGLSAVLSEYAALEELCRLNKDRELPRVQREIAELKKDYTIGLTRLDKGVLSELPAFVVQELGGVADRAADSAVQGGGTDIATPTGGEDSAPLAQTAAAKRVLKPTGHYVGMTSVNIAPITLDVSDIVEQAIAAAIGKLSKSLDKKLEEYLSGVELPIPERDPQSPSDGPTQTDVAAVPTLESLQELSQRVENANEALRALTAELDGIYAAYTEAGRNFRELAEGEREILESAKELARMQREIMRLQQGVRVGQRILNDEQADPERSRAVLVKKSAEPESDEK